MDKTVKVDGNEVTFDTELTDGQAGFMLTAETLDFGRWWMSLGHSYLEMRTRNDNPIDGTEAAMLMGMLTMLQHDIISRVGLPDTSSVDIVDDLEESLKGKEQDDDDTTA